MTEINIIECSNDLPVGVKFPNGMAAIDCEMMGLNLHRDRLCLCQIGDGEGNVWLVKFDGENYENAPNLKALLENPRVLKILHFGRYDLASIKHYMDIDVAPVYDTKIASKLCRTYASAHGLKALTEEIAGVKIEKGEQTSYWGAAELTESQKKYAANDVIYLHQIKQGLDAQLKDLNRTNLARQCFAFLPVRVALDLEGWENVDIFAHH